MTTGSGLHEWASSYTGQQKIIGALVVGCVVAICYPPARKWGVVAIVGMFVLGVLVDLIHPGAISGQRVAP
jgi:Kef-type K+ transport system membrane component KefB